MGQSPLSLGVVVPTLNCAHLLTDHLDSMEPWLDLADQIVVVDSYSNDGTWEMLQDRLSRHAGAGFHRHPRGLYQSWNHGIRQLQTEHAYISTVGDSITRAGLEHLISVADSLHSDVVISKPDFIAEDGTPSQRVPRWPIDDVLDFLQLNEPSLLDDWILGLFLLENPVDAILGSSASNLYRTRLLQDRPFPTEYGTVGDGAWGFTNVFHYRLAVTPKLFSTFRQHEKAYTANTYAVDDLRERLFTLLVQSVERELANKPTLKAQADTLEYGRLILTVEQRMLWQRRLENCREQRLPWALNPRAWYCRKMRNEFRTKAAELRKRALRVCGYPA